MKLTHVVASVDDPTAGPSFSVPNLCDALNRLGDEVDLHTVAGWRSSGPSRDLPYLTRHPQDFAAAPGLGALCLSGDLRRALRGRAQSVQVIHTHGLWLAPNIYPAHAAQGTTCKTVIAPRGMLGGAALGFSSWKKRLLWMAAQRNAVSATDCLHATGHAEYEEIRAFGVDRPVAIVANGVDIPPAGRAKPSPHRTVLTLGRIHPKKGLDQLVEAWREIEPHFPQWRLRIVGPSELGHADELKAQAARLGLQQVSIEDPVLGEDKLAVLREADLFILPTLNENFALTVAEALAAGTPVISTKGAPWSGLEPEGCGWWVDVGPPSLAAALNKAMVMTPDALAAMGERGRAWMLRDFSWDQAAAKMHAAYAWMTGSGEKPDFVLLD